MEVFSTWVIFLFGGSFNRYCNDLASGVLSYAGKEKCTDLYVSAKDFMRAIQLKVLDSLEMPMKEKPKQHHV